MAGHQRDRPQWRRNEYGNQWVARMRRTAAVMTSAMMSVAGEVGQLHALEVGPQPLRQPLRRLQLGGVPRAVAPPLLSAGSSSRRKLMRGAPDHLMSDSALMDITPAMARLTF
jgi:hypothetical protein